MTACSRGDVVLVGFVFSDESGKKVRPAVVISSAAYHRARQEVVVAAITSNVVRRRLFCDHLISDWRGAGLLFPSVATAIFRTIKRTMIDRKLGTMATPDVEAIDRGLRKALGL
ncbi:MAG: type II toxin-antitoxin system PemK/MazF family toxin [Candidatus Rokuibacteriota bacterium]|nr:MAG: type II toxin-antitoxin system PemK/MazF family toxin [Candidatus Rokubacteria bacterium]